MNVFKKFMGYLVLGAVCLGVVGCSGKDDGDTQQNPLVLTLSQAAVGFDAEITFKVTNLKKDVTKTAEIISLDEGNKVIAGAWKANKAGSYRFVAKFENMTSSPVSCVVTEFERQALGIDFTSVFCPNCPNMTFSLDKFERDYPGQMVVMAAHVNYGDNPLMTDKTNALALTGVGTNTGAPYLWVDYHGGGISSAYSTIVTAVKKSITQYAPVSTIKINSSVSGRKVTIDVGAKFLTSEKFKIGVVLTENGISQPGFYEPVYNHVVREFATDIMGDDIGTSSPTKEYAGQFTFTADANWKLENCDVVVYLLKEVDAKHGYTVNNVRKCAVDGSVTYR